MNKLVRMGRDDLLRRALAAPPIEGRIYAAIGLARLEIFRWSDVEARIAAEHGLVNTCDGCLVQQVFARDAIAYYRGCSESLYDD